MQQQWGCCWAWPPPRGALWTRSSARCCSCTSLLATLLPTPSWSCPPWCRLLLCWELVCCTRDHATGQPSLIYSCVFPWGQVCTTVSSSLYAKGHPCVSPQVQASALLGVGLLCQGPCHNVIAGADSKLLQAACLLIVPIFDVRPTSHSQPIVKRN